MPFQVSISIKKQTNALNLIKDYSVPNDVVVGCVNNSVILTAVVNESLDNHSILWEQILGSAVTWISPQDQLEAEFQILLVDDKIFRFWIDKGTQYETFKDVFVFAKSTERVSFNSTIRLYQSNPTYIISTLPSLKLIEQIEQYDTNNQLVLDSPYTELRFDRSMNTDISSSFELERLISSNLFLDGTDLLKTQNTISIVDNSNNVTSISVEFLNGINQIVQSNIPISTTNIRLVSTRLNALLGTFIPTDLTFNKQIIGGSFTLKRITIYDELSNIALSSSETSTSSTVLNSEIFSMSSSNEELNLNNQTDNYSIQEISVKDPELVLIGLVQTEVVLPTFVNTLTPSLTVTLFNGITI